MKYMTISFTEFISAEDAATLHNHITSKAVRVEGKMLAANNQHCVTTSMPYTHTHHLKQGPALQTCYRSDNVQQQPLTSPLTTLK